MHTCCFEFKKKKRLKTPNSEENLHTRKPLNVCLVFLLSFKELMDCSLSLEVSLPPWVEEKGPFGWRGSSLAPERLLRRVALCPRVKAWKVKKTVKLISENFPGVWPCWARVALSTEADWVPWPLLKFPDYLEASQCFTLELFLHDVFAVQYWGSVALDQMVSKTTWKND